MVTTIVVVGSVTSKQYQSVRLEQLRQGNKPRIERLDSTKFLSEQYLPKGDCDDSEQEYYEKLLSRVHDEIFGVPNPRAFICDHETWQRWDSAARSTFREWTDQQFDYFVVFGYVDSNGQLVGDFFS